jgi:outer membrane protein assembly factor BamB
MLSSSRARICGFVAMAVVFVACAAQEGDPPDNEATTSESSEPREPALSTTTIDAVTTQFDPTLCGSTTGYQPNAPWPGFGACPTDRRSSPQAGTQSGYVNWTATTGGAVQSSPAVAADGTVYVGSNDGKLYALTSDGTTRWSKSLVGAVHGSPAIGADGTIYVGSDLSGLYALNPADGSTRWTFSSIPQVRSSPVLGSDGTIYFAASPQILTTSFYGLTSAGATRFHTSVNGQTSSAPAIGPNGTVYLATDGTLLVAKTLYAFNPKTGLPAWSAQVGAAGVTSVSGPAVGADGTIYVGTGSSAGTAWVKAYTPNGALKWMYPITCGVLTDCGVSATPAIGPDGNVYVGSDDGRFWAIRSGDVPSLLWQVTSGSRIEASAAIDASGTIYIGGAGNDRLVALRSADGSVVFSTTAGGPIRSSAAIDAYGTVYFGSDDAKVYSVGERYSGFVQGTSKIPIGTCVNNRVPAGTTTQVCLTQPAPAVTIDIYVNGHLTPSPNNCVSVTVNDTTEIRSFELGGGGFLSGSHIAFLTTTAHAKHCPIYDNILLGGLGDDVLVGTPADEYISGGPGVDYIVSGGGNDVIVGGDDPDTIDLTGPTKATSLAPGLKLVGADLTQDRVLANFDPSTLPASVFATAQSCTTPGCQNVPPSFERIYTELEDPSGYSKVSLSSIRQSYDIGGGYVACGSRTKADNSASEGIVVKFTPQGNVAWMASSAGNPNLAAAELNDVREYYDRSSKRLGYVVVGDYAGTESFLMVVDLQGNQLAYTVVDGDFFDANGHPQGTGQARLARLVTGPNFVLAAGFTNAPGSTPFPDGTYRNQPGQKGYVVAYANHIAGGAFDQPPVVEAYAPAAANGFPGNSAFENLALIPPSGSQASWSVALGGFTNLGGPAPGSTFFPNVSAFAVVAQIGSGISGTIGGGMRILPTAIRQFLGGTDPEAQVTAIASVPGAGLVLAGVSQGFRAGGVFIEPVGFLKPTDDSLADTAGVDPNEGPFFTPTAGYDFLGGSSPVAAGLAHRLNDGSFLFLGSSVYPWSDALLSSVLPLELIGGDFPSHALYVHTDANEGNRAYHSYGHDPANPATHVINSSFSGSDLTPDLGFVASAIACPGASPPCLAEAYVVKAAPDLSSPALACSCSNGYADCGESATGYASASATHPGDCGGPCAPCAIDCGDGVQDNDEENTDCGGSCANPAFSPTHQPLVCACKPGDCDDGNACTVDSCDPKLGCGHDVHADDGQSCGGVKVCQSGTCGYDCSSCSSGNECAAASCTTGLGCITTNLPDQTPCSAGFCVGGQCAGFCTVTNCATTQACKVGGCDPTSKQCTLTNLPDGQACGTNDVCLNGSCVAPAFEQNVLPIAQKYCAGAGCHSSGTPTCGAGVCFVTCFDAITKTVPGCSSGFATCMGSQMASGAMPASMNCTTHGTGCPTPEEISIVQSWAATGAIYDSGGSTPPACQ